jgi:hypothetical protein
MEIKESEIRKIFKNKSGFYYYKKPMTYMVWRIEWKKKELIKFMGKEKLKIIRDDPESYPNKSKQISPRQAIW